MIVAASLDARAAIRAETTFSFLGLGIQPPTPSWGNLLTHAATNIFLAPLQVFLPGLFIFFALISFNLLGMRCGTLWIRVWRNVSVSYSGFEEG